MMMHRLPTLLLISMLVMGIWGCKKSDGPTPSEDPQDEETLLRDSTYFYSILFSLWTNQLPQPEGRGDDLDLQAYTGKFKDAEEVLVDLRKYANEDRFSFVDRAGKVSEEIQEGVYEETGVIPIYLSSDGSDNGDLYIKLVQRGSPAERAGLKRGMRVLSLNGDTQLDYLTDQQQSLRNFYAFFSGETLELIVQQPGAETTETITVTGSAYYLNPVIDARVIDLDGHKVGYFAYTSFLNVWDSHGNPNAYHEYLLALFRDFEKQQIDELVVDLRYNGGGATNAAELMASLIVPVANGQDRMYTYKVNPYLEEAGFTDVSKSGAPFVPVHFQKPNALDLSRVYFLATQSSASASELVINVLKPYMDVELITTNRQGTFGKPVGFFGYPVVNGYADLYITSFQMLNSAGFGDYFSGLMGQKNDAQDGFLQQLGDPDESMLAEALHHIQQGSYRTYNGAKSSNRSTLRNTLRGIRTPETHPHRNNMYRFGGDVAPNLSKSR